MLVIGGLLAVVIAAAVGMGLIYFRAVNNYVRTGQDLCPIAGPRAQTIVLVDATDTLSALTRSEIAQRLADLAASTPKGSRLDIRTLRSDDARTNAIFSLCNPGDGSDLDPLIANPEAARRKWEEGFSAPLEVALEASTGEGEADTSPIMAAIQQIAVERLTSASDRSIPTSLVVVSDMLENSPLFSMYRSGANYAAYAASPAANAYASNLTGATVDVWLVRRDAAPADANALIDFWDRWFTESGATIAHALRLQGVD